MGIYSGNVYRVLGVRIKRVYIQYKIVSLLNTVFSSQKECVDNVKICEPLACSDHNQIYVIIKLKGERNRKIPNRK